MPVHWLRGSHVHHSVKHRHSHLQWVDSVCVICWSPRVKYGWVFPTQTKTEENKIPTYLPYFEMACNRKQNFDFVWPRSRELYLDSVLLALFTFSLFAWRTVFIKNFNFGVPYLPKLLSGAWILDLTQVPIPCHRLRDIRRTGSF